MTLLSAISDLGLRTSDFGLLSESTPALWPTIEHIALLVAIAGGIVAIFVSRRKRQNIRIDQQPVEVSGTFDANIKSRRYSPSTCDAVHREADRRLADHDKQLRDLWITVRDEDSKTRASLAAAIRDFDRITSRLEGLLANIEKANDMILHKLLQS